MKYLQAESRNFLSFCLNLKKAQISEERAFKLREGEAKAQGGLIGA